MFINWLKLKRIINESNKDININNCSNINYNCRISDILLLSLNQLGIIIKRNFKRVDLGIRNGMRNSSIITNFKVSTEQTTFFKDFADHSNTIINTIKDGYGRDSNFIGMINEFDIIKG